MTPWERWNELWFDPVDARALAVMRVTLGLLLVVWHLSLWPDLEMLAAPWGAVDAELLERAWTPWGISVYAWAANPVQLHLIHAGFLAAIVAFTVGWRTRVAAFLTLLMMVSFWHCDNWFHNGGDRLLRISLFYMALAPCGAAWSLDARRTGGSSTVPTMAHRLLQLQWMVMYTYTGFAKLPGHNWQDGTALYYALSDASYSRFPALMDVLLSMTWVQHLTRLATWVTLGWELAFVPLVLWPKTRWLALGIGALFHLVIFVSMDVAFFSPIAVWGYLAWAQPKWLVDAVESMLRRVRPASVSDDPATRV